MMLSKPNRTRNRSSSRSEVGDKQSGDQHILPLDEPAQSPHRPHRLNREDMSKTLPGARAPDETTEE